MLDKGARICPCCGKELVLTGAVKGAKINDTLTGGYKSDTFSYHYRRVFEQDKLWECSVDMFCSACGNKIRLQENPHTLLILILILTLIGIVLIGVCIGLISLLWAIVALAILVVLDIVLFGVYAYKLRYIKKWRSNFVCAECEPFKPHILLCADISDIAPEIFYTANIFTFSLDNRKEALYLSEYDIDERAGADMYFHICGDEKNFNSTISFLETNSGKITLNFEGYNIPNVKFVKTII